MIFARTEEGAAAIAASPLDDPHLLGMDGTGKRPTIGPRRGRVSADGDMQSGVPIRHTAVYPSIRMDGWRQLSGHYTSAFASSIVPASRHRGGCRGCKPLRVFRNPLQLQPLTVDRVQRVTWRVPD